MYKRTFSVVLVATLAVLCSFPASAQLNRTFVSTAGSDLNSCALASPCRTFQQAHDQTNPGGEITVLSTGGFGSVTITKTISIINDGIGEAGITTSSFVDGIKLSVAPTDAVTLRGLTLVGGWNGSSPQGVGRYGINLGNGGGTLNIQNTVIRGFQQGIRGLLTTSSPTNLNVSDTIVSNNLNDGVYISTRQNGAAKLTFDRVQSLSNGCRGFYLIALTGGGLITAVARNSVAAGHLNCAGFAVFGADAVNAATLTLVDSQVVNNIEGLFAQNVGSTILISNTTVTGDSIPLNTGQPLGFNIDNNAKVISFGDNYITDLISQTNGGTFTTMAKQ